MLRIREKTDKCKISHQTIFIDTCNVNGYLLFLLPAVFSNTIIFFSVVTDGIKKIRTRRKSSLFDKKC